MKDFFLVLVITLAIFAKAETLTVEGDSSAVFRIDEIRYDIGDVFDDSRIRYTYDKWLCDLLVGLHFKTRESTVRNLLLFDEGDEISKIQVQEAERFLRTQRYLSDAKITILNEDGKNIANVHTSDNWTLSPSLAGGFNGSKKSYDNLHWYAGIQESNFLGFGQMLDLLYEHTYYRNMLTLGYGAPHFLFRYNHLDAAYSYTSDGYLTYLDMYLPYLSRSQNQWAYNFSGLLNKRSIYAYSSGKIPPGTTRYGKKKSLDAVPKYNGDDAVTMMRVDDFVEDSLNFTLGRSFGGTYRKLYIGATYDYHLQSAENGKLIPYTFTLGDEKVYAIDSNYAWKEWVPDKKDSRLGFFLKLSNIHYVKAVNLHHVKWTEDVERGYSLKGQISKNYEQLGAGNNDVRFNLWANLYLGCGMHYLTLKSESRFYLDHWENMHDFYGRVLGEYVLHPTDNLATVFKGFVDFYDKAKFGYQLSLGGEDGFSGLPIGYYTGQARVFGTVEQRMFFPKLELVTLSPVLAGFIGVGETAWEVKDINRDDLIYVLGTCVYFAQTKSFSRTINKMGVSFPMNGKRKGIPHYIITTTVSL